MTLIAKSNLAIFYVSPANVIDEMMWNETYLGGSMSLLQKKKIVSYATMTFVWKNKVDLICVIYGFWAQTPRLSEWVNK